MISLIITDPCFSFQVTRLENEIDHLFDTVDEEDKVIELEPSDVYLLLISMIIKKKKNCDNSQFGNTVTKMETWDRPIDVLL